jgi:hypothetical protein
LSDILARRKGNATQPSTIESAAWIPGTEAERAAAREQLERILSSHLFRNSKRYPVLLRYVTECALDGRVDHMKERTLGVEVFHRALDYDTNLDPVVRTTAVEVRKRIAQYYQEPGHESELRICIAPGSYLPEFRIAPEKTNEKTGDKTGLEPLPPSPLARKPRAIFAAAVAAGIISITLLAAVFWGRLGASPNTALERFWNPVWNSPMPVLMVIGRATRAQDTPGATPPSAPSSVLELMREEAVAFADATTLARLTGLMVAKGKPFHIRRYTSAKFDDLRDGPAILIGAFNNDWTLKLSGQLRFRFERESQRASWVSDQNNPGQRQWLMNMELPYSSFQQDYAVISRVLDPTTGRLVVTAGGLSKYGTAAAGEFLTDPLYMKEITAHAPKDWDRGNIQIVISTRLMGESSGPPQIVATHFW